MYVFSYQKKLTRSVGTLSLAEKMDIGVIETLLSENATVTFSLHKLEVLELDRLVEKENVWLYLVAGEVVGLACCGAREEGKFAEISLVFTKPTYSGDMDLDSALLTTLLRHLTREKGIPVVFLLADAELPISTKTMLLAVGFESKGNFDSYKLSIDSTVAVADSPPAVRRKKSIREPPPEKLMEELERKEEKKLEIIITNVVPVIPSSPTTDAFTVINSFQF